MKRENFKSVAGHVRRAFGENQTFVPGSRTAFPSIQLDRNLISLADWKRCSQDHIEAHCTKIVSSTYEEQLAIINFGANDGRFGLVSEYLDFR